MTDIKITDIKITDIKITKTGIDGLYVIEPTQYSDESGCFYEVYNSKSFSQCGLNHHFVQDNEVFSKKDVLRGMHVNVRHPQGKMIKVLEGKIFDVVIDLRRDSKTYMASYAVVLSDENKKQLYIPEGMGHGYLALTDTRIQFKVTSHYIPDDEVEFAWNSKAITDIWPINAPIQSERDRNSKDLEMIWK